jgi:predicted phosphohydrolase
VLLAGDIGEAPDLVQHLETLAGGVPGPIYFVLGNHDFYRGSIASVRRQMEALCADRPNLRWLPRAGVVQLTEQTGLVGADGWGDGQLGDYWGSRLKLTDWRLIEEFAGLDQRQRLDKLQALGEEAAVHFRSVLPAALHRFQHVLVVTHVPPFREACWYNGRFSNDEWLPHFTCKAVGDVLTEVMTKHPDRQITVFCGHTHSAGEQDVLPKLKVLTGGAVYGSPTIQQVIEIV